MEHNKRGGLILREAAGIYWLIDTEQEGLPYRRPVRLNESGAQIWRMLESGLTAEQASARLAAGEGLPYEEVLADIRAFEATLRARL